MVSLTARHSGRALLIGVALLIAVSACGTGSSDAKGAHVDKNLTKQAALSQMSSYLHQTLAALPHGVSLSSKKQDSRRGQLSPNDVAPCTNQDTSDPSKTPSQVQANYWIVNLPKGNGAEYFKKITELWQSWGFRATSKPTATWAPFANKEGYELVLNSPSQQSDTMSITSGTPCIDPAHFHGAQPMPEVIHRPGKKS